MKLISCYIENFGNLSEVSFNFDSNLTSFYHENGYGKYLDIVGNGINT